MAMKLNVDAKRGDLLFVNPFDVVVHEDLRGRHKPPTETEVIALALSLLENEQQMPCVARRNADKDPMLVSGFTRCAAARLIRQGFVDSEGVERQDENFKLQIVIRDCNDEESFKRNVVENAHRNQTSPVDDAYNQRRLRERYGMTDTDIAKLYNTTPATVSRLTKIHQMEFDLQDLIHDGRMGLNAAIDLLDVSEEERARIIAECTKGNGKVNGAQVRSAVRDTILADADTEGAGTGNEVEVTVEEEPAKPVKAAKPRSVREVRKYFEALTENEDAQLARFGKDVLKYLAGKSTDKALDNALKRLREVEVPVSM